MSIGSLKSTIGILAIVYCVIALALVFWIDALKRINRISKMWISTRKLTKLLDIMHDIDDQLFNMRSLLAIVAVILAAFMLYVYVKL